MPSLDFRWLGTQAAPLKYKTKRRAALAVSAAICTVWAVGIADVHAQTLSGSPGPVASPLVPPWYEEVADQERPFWTLKKFPSQSYMKEYFWNFPPETPAFFRDSLLQLVARTYYLTRDNFNGTETDSWAGGGWIAWRSGLIANMFGVHAALYTSQPIYAPSDRDNARLLAPGQNSLAMLGQLYGRVQVGDQEFRGGRQLVDTPLINAQDNRMVPNTFTGVTLVSLPDKDRKYDYAIGYLWDIKQRNSNDFIPMSDALFGSDVRSRGTPFAMLKYRPVPGLSTAIMDYYIEDFINTAYGQIEYDFDIPKDKPDLVIGANIYDQRSVGSDLLTGAPFHTYQASAKVQTSYKGWTLFVAGSITGDESAIFSPFGSKQNYTDMQQVSFDNAGEKAFGGSIAYDFGSAGLPGWSAGVWYTGGWDAVNPATGLAIADRREFDVWLQFRPKEGQWKGFRFKTQYGKVWQDGNPRDAQPEFRVIVDYTILFRPPLAEVAEKRPVYMK
jgi:hypothetical protein